MLNLVDRIRCAVSTGKMSKLKLDDSMVTTRKPELLAEHLEKPKLAVVDALRIPGVLEDRAIDVDGFGVEVLQRVRAQRPLAEVLLLRNELLVEGRDRRDVLRLVEQLAKYRSYKHQAAIGNVCEPKVSLEPLRGQNVVAALENALDVVGLVVSPDHFDGPGIRERAQIPDASKRQCIVKVH